MQNTDLTPDSEMRCRARLSADPADAIARLELARCLFMRAFHCINEAKLPSVCAARQEPERALLKESLMQAAVSALLCVGEAGRKSAKEIAERAREWGEGDLVDEAERETQAMQRHLTVALNKK